MSSNDDDEVAKAKEWLKQAQEIRESIPDSVATSIPTTTNDDDKDAQKKESNVSTATPSQWNVPDEDTYNDNPCIGYRLYVDVGREEGTWMDYQWGASGSRIEFTIDVSFVLPKNTDTTISQDISTAGKDVIDKLSFDGRMIRSSPIRVLRSAPYCRLRGGFDKMGCINGGYRIDAPNSASPSSGTARFFIQVDGTSDAVNGKSNYGDIDIPSGCLYFSLPCFGNSVRQLSSKEGIVSVRQTGWHTGWRREESRIVGTFRVLPIEEASRKNKF